MFGWCSCAMIDTSASKSSWLSSDTSLNSTLTATVVVRHVASRTTPKFPRPSSAPICNVYGWVNQTGLRGGASSRVLLLSLRLVDPGEAGAVRRRSVIICNLIHSAMLPAAFACYCLSGWLRRGQRFFNPGAIHLFLLFIRIKKPGRSH